MALKLFVHSRFEASHSLSGNEKPHPHLWLVRLEVESCELKDGKLLDLELVHAGLETILKEIRGKYLNENSYVSESVNRFPTCETLSEFIFTELSERVFPGLQKAYPEARLRAVRVGLNSADDTLWGESDFSR